MRRDESQLIPDGFQYLGLQGLSKELQAKLDRVQPATLAQAGRVEGMTPAALTLILARIKINDRDRVAR